MKKRQLPARIKDHICPTAYRAERRNHQPDARDFYADPTPPKPRRRISYVPGVKPREEPTEIPRLSIRGLIGGSVKMDLRGLNVGFSEAAFAHWVHDESLKKLHIHRGDIAIIDPLRPMLQERNLILVSLDSREVLRRLRKKHRIWYLETADGTPSEPVPLLDHPLHGAVLGILRLFTKVKAVNFRGTDANLAVGYERSYSSAAPSQRSAEVTAKPPHPETRYRKHRHRPFLLAGEQPTQYLLSEIEQKPGYPA